MIVKPRPNLKLAATTARHRARMQLHSQSPRRPCCCSAVSDQASNEAVDRTLVTRVPDVPDPQQLQTRSMPGERQIWRWRGHTICYVVSGSGPPIVLVHGFGASLGHWRKNVPAIAENHQVWALDLLGQGSSDKPLVTYTIELWAEQLKDFIVEFQITSPVLIGNSVGSLVCLVANADLPEGAVAGTVLINCAGGMNNKAIVEDWRIRLALPIFWLIDFLLSKPRIARYLFNRFRTKENLRNILMNIYTDPLAVDDQLISLLHDPSGSQGALEAFVSIITGPPGPPPAKLLPNVNGPLLVLWGDADSFTPVDGPVGKLFRALPAKRPETIFKLLPGQNHCVHDDNPSLVNSIITDWLSETPALRKEGATSLRT